jgi:XTP/dITP diphosphohydrolase
MASETETGLTIHLATGNAHKAEEFQRLADASGWAVRIVPAAQMPPVEEDTGTFPGNARKKALALRRLLPPGSWVLADDSGLCVDALGGLPGVESAYYAGPAGDPRANLEKLVAVMRLVPAERRGAQFRCVLVLLGPLGLEQSFEGRCEGTLRVEPAGGAGFGYDPLFVPEGQERTYAELSAAEKNKTSHRARAWLALVRWWRRSAVPPG